jgi:hypothetical protein
MKKIFIIFMVLAVVFLSSCAGSNMCPAYVDNTTEDTTVKG